jgi:hypothetical protein
MEMYNDIGSDSGVVSFKSAADSISIQFKKSDQIYKYTYASAGAKNIEAMKLRAISGDGLNSYILRNVQNKFVK